ncbi:hypothetical protein [Spirosoma telluris]
MKPDLITRFFQDTDETGRFAVTSSVTGVGYFVEPIGNGRGGDWGSYNPSTGNIEHKKGDGKNTGSVMLTESIITPENGFRNISHLGVGESPFGEISRRDTAYEAQGVRPC